MHNARSCRWQTETGQEISGGWLGGLRLKLGQRQKESQECKFLGAHSIQQSSEHLIQG